MIASLNFDSSRTNGISIITPVFNRPESVIASVQSSVNLVSKGYALEVIIVDDCSTDNTVNVIKKNFKTEINDEIIKIVELQENLGVTGAKNAGAKIAKGTHLAFMDSDDEFLLSGSQSIVETVNSRPDIPLFFFRCIDKKSKELIGSDEPEKTIDLKTLLREGTPGECLPVVSANHFYKNPYVEFLRGCEGITYLKILENHNKALVSSQVARLYCTEGSDRLSVKRNISKRASRLIVYNIMMLRYTRYMTLKRFFKTVLKIPYYTILYISSKVNSAD